MLQKISHLVKESLYKGEDKPSSSRIFSYVMMFIILLLGLTHTVIEIGNAILEWKKGDIYVPSWQSITVIGMWLAHQLTLLGIYKSNEIKIPYNKTFENKGDIK